ncbi:hypothetical protein K7432_012289 [Basidiobolus ranarum]|uniref:Chitin-binding type-4 domain-containing protein n=1 Tax=Basidiobolus ranarum TaxID=34480 RepID=A0ABR2VSG7_9FUNG
MFTSKFLLMAFLVIATGQFVLAHMEMKYPYPRHSQFSPYYRKNKPDWDLTSPLGLKRRYGGTRTYPCHGWPKGPNQYVATAGRSIPVEITGPNTHKGGHCQFALSYDNGKNFVVLKDVFHKCLTSSGKKFSIKIPSNAPPTKHAVFAWTWINAQGYREYYMGCSDIEIKGGKKGGTVKGKELLVVNIKGKKTVGEFYYKWNDDGMSLFKKRKTLTVNANGSVKKS